MPSSKLGNEGIQELKSSETAYTDALNTVPQSTEDGNNDVDKELHDSHTAMEGKDIETNYPPSSSDAENDPPVTVPRLKRRGLFGQLTLLAEVENPKVYPRKTKWFITFIVAMAGSTAPMGSAILFRESLFHGRSRTPTLISLH